MTPAGWDPSWDTRGPSSASHRGARGLRSPVRDTGSADQHCRSLGLTGFLSVTHRYSQAPRSPFFSIKNATTCASRFLVKNYRTVRLQIKESRSLRSHSVTPSTHTKKGALLTARRVRCSLSHVTWFLAHPCSVTLSAGHLLPALLQNGLEPSAYPISHPQDQVPSRHLCWEVL